MWFRAAEILKQEEAHCENATDIANTWNRVKIRTEFLCRSLLYVLRDNSEGVQFTCAWNMVRGAMADYIFFPIREAQRIPETDTK